MDDALLARDTPDEQDDRLARVDAEALERVRCRDRAIELGIDAVVDDVDSLGPHRRDAQDVGASPGRNGNDGIGHAERRLLDPAGKIVSTP